MTGIVPVFRFAQGNMPGDVCEGGDVPGLSWHTIDHLARELEDWAYAHREDPAINDRLEPEARRRVVQAGVLPEFIEIEAARVLECLFEGQEARRAHTP